MKTITKYLVGFAVTIIILTIIFRITLSYSIEKEMYTITHICGVFYFITMFISGWFWGKKDGEYLPIYDVGFRFHCTTYLSFTTISELWFISGFNSVNENVKSLHYTAIIWGFFLFIHFFFYLYCRKKSINGLNKEDIFE